MRTLSASVSLPLPVDSCSAKIMENIIGGGVGTLFGNQIWKCLPQLGAKNCGMARQRPYCGYSDWILFLKEEGGNINVVEIYSAKQYDAVFIRKIVGYCVTEFRGCPYDLHNRLPTVEEIARKL